ncbi:MAG: hypothetical protein HOO67_00050, partial [Candidatus Peribacteraceae bacterium]|nr:hypothetical protein [Candidatus Peribacteraceae bacterium]
MYFRPRHRRGTYPLAREHALPRGVRLLLAVGAVLFAAYLLWTLLLSILGLAGGGERAGAMLMTEDRGTVTVTIDGKQQRAENGMMLFPGESVATGPGAHASLQFFDGSRARMNDGAELALIESSRGSSSSRVSMELKQGTLWLLTADSKSFSGSVLLSVTTPMLSFEVPRGAEATLSPTSLVVYSDEGQGIGMTVAGHDAIVISEGQQWAIAAGSAVGDDLYALRSPLDPVAARTPFVLESRQKLLPRAASGTSTSGRPDGAELISLTLPAANSTLTQATVDVRGTVGAGVTSVLVNGYPAVFDAAKGTFSQQLSPPDGTDDIEIHIQALDAQRNVLGDFRRMVKRAPAAPLEAPTVTVPAKTGQTYRTASEELILRGTAPVGAKGIMVNDYKLQLFDPVKGEWSYVASIRLRNMVTGINTYDVTALDAAGKKSAAARITIL